jgi:hypothetical protein
MTNKEINLGICPECKDYTHFHILKKLKKQYSLMICDMCKKQVVQYVNGKVHYERLDNSFFRGMNIGYDSYEDDDY